MFTISKDSVLGIISIIIVLGSGIGYFNFGLTGEVLLFGMLGLFGVLLSVLGIFHGEYFEIRRGIEIKENY